MRRFKEFGKSHLIMSLSVSLLIIALSVAYYFAIVLPNIEKQKLDLLKQKANYNDNSINIEPSPIVSPSPIVLPSFSSEITPSRTELLNNCLSQAEQEKNAVVENILAWAKEENKDGKYNLTNAWDDIDEEYERDRQDCFAKYR